MNHPNRRWKCRFCKEFTVREKNPLDAPECEYCTGPNGGYVCTGPDNKGCRHGGDSQTIHHGVASCHWSAAYARVDRHYIDLELTPTEVLVWDDNRGWVPEEVSS